MSNKIDTLKGKIILGIDLGTTNSGVAVWNDQDRKVVMLKDTEGYQLTPSMVGWDRVEKEWVVGHAAKELGKTHPSKVAYSIKRYIGRWFTDRQVFYDDYPFLTYKLVWGGGTDPLHDVVADFGADRNNRSIQLTAPDISAKVLFKLRQDAAKALGVPIGELKYAVVTVPAYFNVLQRRATILAGQLAGLDVVDILNEPTAAALAYKEKILEHDEKRILVYDLGGGTFDISLLEASRDEEGYVFYTRVVDGDTRLGGDDIDTNLAQLLAEEIKKRYGQQVRPDDYLSWERLRREAEQAKISLSTEEVYTVVLPELSLGTRSPFDAEVKLERAHIEECASAVLQRTRTILKRAVEEVAGLGWDQIDEVILVGGQILMPAIQRDIEDLTGHTPRVKDEPQLAVALGAGEYARILSLGRERFHENTLINVVALPLGICLDENTFETLVPANVTVPHTSQPFPVTTTKDDQGLIRVEIYQGQRGAEHTEKCVLLDSIKMEVLPAPKGTPRFDVQFEVLSDGTMRVIVSDKYRNRTETLDIIDTKRTLVWRDQPTQTGGRADETE